MKQLSVSKRARIAGALVVAMILLLIACRPQRDTGPAWIARHAPWPEIETADYDVLRNDTVVGHARFQIGPAPAGYEITCVNSSFIDGVTILHDSIAATLSRDSLLPRAAFQVRNYNRRLDTVVSRYSPGKVSLTLNGGKTANLPLSRNSFDNSILTMAIRALDLKPGASFALTSVASYAEHAIPADVKVLGEDTVSVPAGRFICRKVSLQIAGTTLYLWYERDGARRYVKYEHADRNSKAILAGFAVE